MWSIESNNENWWFGHLGLSNVKRRFVLLCLIEPKEAINGKEFIVNWSLKVAIDARLPDAGQGGVQQVINTMSSGFNELRDSSVKRYWIVMKGTSWWKGSFPSGDEILEVNPPFGKISLYISNRFPKLVSFVFPIVSRLFRDKNPYDDLLQRLGIELVHLPFQDGFKTELPVVYHPHDLQHKYMKDNFRKSQIKHREDVWRNNARRANVVMAASPYVVADLENYWNIPRRKIKMIPIPPPTREHSDDSVLQRVPAQYCLYPAAFWKHKNHSNLLQALNLLRQQGTQVNLVLVGATVGTFHAISDLITDLELSNQVTVLGHVSNSELTSLLKNAQFVIIPSLFEAMSLTVWDAQKLGTSVACSNVAPFPCQVADTAELFNPYDPNSIAVVMLELWTDNVRRGELSQKALKRTAGLTAENYACAIIGIYQTVLGRDTNETFTLATQKLVSAICSEAV